MCPYEERPHMIDFARYQSSMSYNYEHHVIKFNPKTYRIDWHIEVRQLAETSLFAWQQMCLANIQIDSEIDWKLLLVFELAASCCSDDVHFSRLLSLGHRLQRWAEESSPR